MNRARDVLQRLLTQVNEFNLCFAMKLIVDRRRNADAARLRDAFKTSCDIDAVSEDVVWFDDYIADIDAYTKSDTTIFRIGSCKFMDTGLKPQCSSNRFDRA